MEYTFKNLKNDPDFLKLSPEDQTTILNDNDEDFRQLSLEDQSTIIKDISLIEDPSAQYWKKPLPEKRRIDPAQQEIRLTPEDEETIRQQGIHSVEDLLETGDIAADWAPEVLATVGGMVGFGMGAGGGSIPLGIAGAGISGGFGEELKQKWYQLTGRKELPKTKLEYLKVVGMAGLEQAAYESLGGVAGKVTGWAGKRLAKKHILVKGKPVVPTWGESMALDKTGKTLIEGFETIATFGYKGSKQRKLKLLSEAADDIVGITSNKARGDMGAWLSDSIQKTSEVLDGARQVTFNNIKEEAVKSGLTTDISRWKKRAESILRKQYKFDLPRSKTLERLLAFGDKIPYNDAKIFQDKISELMKMEKNAEFHGLYTDLYLKTKQNLTNTIKNSGNIKLKKDYDDLIKFDKGYLDFLKYDIVESIIKKSDPIKGGDPTGLLSYIKGVDGYKRVKEIKDMIKLARHGTVDFKKGIENFGAFQREIFYDLIQESTIEKGGVRVLNGQLLKRNINEISKPVRETIEKKGKEKIIESNIFNEVFQPGLPGYKNKAKDINLLAETMARMEGTGKVKIIVGVVGSAVLYGGGGYSFLADPGGTAGRVTQVGLTVTVPIAVFAAITRTRGGLKLLAQLAKTKPEKAGPIIARLNKQLEWFDPFDFYEHEKVPKVAAGSTGWTDKSPTETKSNYINKY